MPSSREDERSPEPPDVDAAGVDREQIRAFLKLSPEERLRRIEEHVEAILEIREKNAAGRLR